MSNTLWNMIEIDGKCIIFRGNNDEGLPVREDYVITLDMRLVQHPVLQMRLHVKIEKRNNFRTPERGLYSEYEPVKEFGVELTQEDHYLKYDDEEYAPKDFVSVSLFKKLNIAEYCDVVGVKL